MHSSDRGWYTPTRDFPSSFDRGSVSVVGFSPSPPFKRGGEKDAEKALLNEDTCSSAVRGVSGYGSGGTSRASLPTASGLTSRWFSEMRNSSPAKRWRFEPSSPTSKK